MVPWEATLPFYCLLPFSKGGQFLTLLVPEMKIAEFAKSVGLNEVAHHLDLHLLPSSF